jgi:hypothetical protein
MVVDRFPSPFEKGDVMLDRFPAPFEKGDVMLDRFPSPLEKGDISLDRFPAPFEETDISVDRFPAPYEESDVLLDRFPSPFEESDIAGDHFPPPFEVGRHHARPLPVRQGKPVPDRREICPGQPRDRKARRNDALRIRHGNCGASAPEDSARPARRQLTARSTARGTRLMIHPCRRNASRES